MTNKQRFIFSFMFVVFLFTLLLPCALGSDYLPWDVERIRSYRAWDNDNWNMSNWNTTGAWDTDSGPWNNSTQFVSIAIIDSGIDYTVYNNTPRVHPNLASNVLGMCGFKYDPAHPSQPEVYTDPVNWLGQPNPYIVDTWGHGTRVAGVVAAAITGNGIIGAAPTIGIYSLKINSPGMNESAEEAAAAIRYAVDSYSARVISISYGWDTNYQDLNDSCTYAYSKGALLFAAAGNENTTDLGYPASYANVIAVGATDHNDSRASFPSPDIASNYGPKLMFMAPGVDIYTTDLNNGYVSGAWGTSFSTPLVAATAALVFGSKMDPNFGPSDSFWYNGQVLAKLVYNGTLDLDPPGKDNYTGYGLINAWLPLQRPIGDINNDTTVMGDDLILAASAYGSGWGSAKWDPRADINIDNWVTGDDLIIIARNFGQYDP